MFDSLDIEKLEAEDAKREELKKTYGEVGPDELELTKLREGFMKETTEQNVRSLERMEKNAEELSDDKPLISKDIEKFSEEENKEEVAEEVEQEEESTEEQEELDSEKSEDLVDVNSDTKSSEPTDEWLKEKEELIASMKQKDELLVKMYQELQSRTAPVEQKQDKKEEVVEDDTEILAKAKNVVKSITEYEEEEASIKLAELIKDLSKGKKQELSEDVIEEMLAKREQKKYIEKFNIEKENFFNTDEGKKVLADDDMFDVYKIKLDRLQQSGKHLNPEDLFKSAYENTIKVFKGETKANSSTASKPVPKVSDSLKDGVSKVEGTKKQAVKPTSSSNAGKTADTKKFDATEAWKELQRSMGQNI